MLPEGRYASLSGMASTERGHRGGLGRIPQLTLAVPDIVEGAWSGAEAGQPLWP